jgi:heterodisulfide reductase subunit A
VAEAFDLVVLSVGIAPAGDNRDTAQALGLGQDAFGFLTPLTQDGQGVFLAGTACGPMDVAESIASAGRAAQQTLHYLEEC